MGNTLVFSDFWSMRGWFREQTASKVAVMLGFLVTLGMVSTAIYSGTLLYFRLIIEYGPFGQAVITYTMHASIMLVLVLSVFSGMAAFYASFYKDQRLTHWFSLPIAPRQIWRSSVMRTALATSWPLLVVLLPMIVALTQIRAWEVWVFGVVMLGLLWWLSLSAAAWLIELLVRLWGSVPKGAWVGLGLVMMVSLLVLTKLLFPPAFFKLYLAADEHAFTSGLKQLPLMSQWLPSWWLATTLTSGFSLVTALPLLVAFGLFFGFERIMQKHYVDDWRRMAERTTLAEQGKDGLGTQPRHWPSRGSTTAQLIWHEWVSLGRSGSDRLYAWFILAMGVVYVWLISYVTTSQPIDLRFIPWLTGSLIVGFGFLVTVMMARFAYPLMAKEVKAAWFLFSAPVSRFEIVDAKLFISLLLLIPWLLVGVYGALSMPLGLGTRMVLVWLLLFLGLAILVVQLSLGVIAPNFTEGENSEHSSTSGSGLVATVLSLAMVGLVARSWNNYSQLQSTGQIYMTLGMIGGLCVLLLIGAYAAVTRYRRL